MGRVKMANLPEPIIDPLGSRNLRCNGCSLWRSEPFTGALHWDGA